MQSSVRCVRRPYQEAGERHQLRPVEQQVGAGILTLESVRNLSPQNLKVVEKRRVQLEALREE